jgi:hypothetical protein
MDHTEFGNEFERDVNFIFQELDEFTASYYKNLQKDMKPIDAFSDMFSPGKSIAATRAEKPGRSIATIRAAKIVEWGPHKERICDRSEQDKSELLEEQQLITRLCKTNAKGTQTHSEKIRLQALKTVQKKIKSSIERYDLEWQKNYRLSLLIVNIFLLYIAFVKYMSPPFAIDLIKELNLNGPYYLVVGGFFFILIKTIFEYDGKSIVVMLKRRLELVEQAIELAETDECTNA